MADHANLAEQNFVAGYNCAQSVFCAFADVTGLAPSFAAKMASSFGGGMGRMREVCGAVSAAFLVLGAVRGYDDPEDQDAKTAQYQLVRDYADRFREKHGTILCRELLRGTETTEGAVPEARTPEYYRRRPCAGYVRDAAEILEEMLRSSGDTTDRIRE